jgi:hypothetical protein
MTDFEPGIDTEEMDALGRKIYGEQWPTVRAHNIKRLKAGFPDPLPQSTMNDLLSALRKLVQRKS